MLKRMVSRSAMALVAALLFSAEGGARSEVHHAALCNYRGTSASIIGYSAYGVHNNSTSQTATVTCGGILNQETRSIGVAAGVYDRSASQNVCCTAIWESIATGDTVASASNCTDGFSPSQMTLNMNIPTTSVAVAYVECTIPPKSINGLSHLAAWVAN